MTVPSSLGPLYLLATVLCFGASTAFLRVAIRDGPTDTARLVRISSQTIIVLVGVTVVGAASILTDSIQYGAVYPALNGLLSAVAFIAFSKGLESTDVSIAKPLLAVGTVVSVLLGILFLGEVLTLRKTAGVTFGIAAVYLLTTE